MAPTPHLHDRVRGGIFGQAIGDALGLGTEVMNAEEVGSTYPEGLGYYHQIIQDEHRQRWKPGEWTDDTDQFLCILDSLLEQRRVHLPDIARRIRQWALDSGRGIGSTTLKVLEMPEYDRFPDRAARYVWERSGGRSAPNGAVMRTAILGVWEHPHAERVDANAAAVCRLTHHDPRCVDSCRLVSNLIARALRGEDTPNDPQAVLPADADERTIRYREELQDQPLHMHALDRAHRRRGMVGFPPRHRSRGRPAAGGACRRRCRHQCRCGRQHTGCALRLRPTAPCLGGWPAGAQ